MGIGDEGEAAGIESALHELRPGGWRRANDSELEHLRNVIPSLKRAWKVDIPRQYHKHECVTYGYLLLDEAFPKSEPRIQVPEAVADGAPPWPHIERNGLLCLKATAFNAPAPLRVITTLHYAVVVLSYSEPQRTAEFRREVVSYWVRSRRGANIVGQSLVEVDGIDRDIVYVRVNGGRIVFADDAASLRAWLENSGIEIDGDYPTTRLVWLDPIPTPPEYPDRGQDVITLVGKDNLKHHLRPGIPLPVLMGVRTATGPAFLGTRLNSPPAKRVRKGYRPCATVPPNALIQYYNALPIDRFEVNRVDRRWVLGRDHNTGAEKLREKRVALIGCGALGGFMARLLAEAGIEQFILVDGETLAPHNTARHILGASHNGKSKVRALAELLRKDFPHMGVPNCFYNWFESLSEVELEELEKADLLVSAGIDVKGEVLVEKWRQELSVPPPWLCSWVEEYAHAGHAVGIVGEGKLLDGFDDAGSFLGRLTRWPSGSTQHIEAGCGNSFQPFGAVDLQRTVSMAALMAIEILEGRVVTSERRMWLGDREEVLRKGGAPASEFNTSFCELRGKWPP